MEGEEEEEEEGYSEKWFQGTGLPPFRAEVRQQVVGADI